MTKQANGRIITFYSFSGGTGCTMAVANTAWILAANGKRVLVVDWDLESPGLHRYFQPFIDPAALDAMGGVVDLVREFESAAAESGPHKDNWYAELADVKRHAFALEWPHFPPGGGIDLVTAGRQDDAYAASLSAMDWDVFYTRGGGRFFDALRADMKEHYDYALIDSWAGLSDVAAICTTHLPDAVVDCFTMSDKSIDGAARVAASIRGTHHSMRILPVVMRVDPGEAGRVETALHIARQRFSGLPLGLDDAERDAYWRHVEVPYQSYYACEELLATFGDLPGQWGSLLSSYEQLTWYLTDGEVRALPAIDEGLRRRTIGRFLRRAGAPDGRLFLRYTPDDLVWAEWITEILTSAGVVVVPDGDTHAASSSRQLFIISAGRSAREAVRWPTDPTTAWPPLGVYVTDVHPGPAFSERNSAVLHGLPEQEAVARLLRLVGHTDGPRPVGTLRYPGHEPAVFNVPAPDHHFTGREIELQALRQRLRQGTPVALQGLGGVGKTQIAIGYAHRFRYAYDLIWWIGCDTDISIEVSIHELAATLDIPPRGPETVRAVFAALRRGTPYRRWLVIFDDARDYQQVSRYLPQGQGELLITSRNQSWGERVVPMPVDCFTRVESVSHLRQRVEGLRAEDAVAVAETLGDLPIAVAAAGAWLSDTGASVADYLRLIQGREPGMAAEQAIWDRSLERLQQQSTGAYRLLQLFSVLAPQIALALIYSDEMASALKPYDKSVADRYVRGSLVQQMNRLALLKLDLVAGQIHVHRLLQRVVRERMAPADLDEARHQVHLVLVRRSADLDVGDPRSWAQFDMIWPHLAVSKAATCPDQSVRALVIDRVRYLGLSGGLAEGEALAREVGAAWETLRQRDEDPDEQQALLRQTLCLRGVLAAILRDRGRFAEAYGVDSELLAEQERLLGGHHPHTLMTANGLAADLRALGRYAEALRMDAATYAAWVEQFGQNHSQTLDALNSLGTSLRMAGNYRAARERDAEVYDLRRIITGNDPHPATLRSTASFGRDLRDAGDYENSVRLLREVAVAYADTFGSDSRLALKALTSLAMSLRHAGRAEEAAPLLESAYERFNDTLGPFHPDTLVCRHSWALNLLVTAQVDTARDELRAVRVAYQASLAPRHPYTLVATANLAVVAWADGDGTLARSLADAASRDLAAVLGPRHPLSLIAEMNLALLLAERGERPRAANVLRDVAARLHDVLGPEHPDTVHCETNLALLPVGGPAAGRDHPYRVLDPYPF
jgi:MinD-like ATPase involved in chromosome partitioning or flagellar assembly/tetratricopeptide (TPR) repeat protein